MRTILNYVTIFANFWKQISLLIFLQALAFAYLSINLSQCKLASSGLQQVEVTDTIKVSHFFALEGTPDYSGKVSWISCINFIEGQSCTPAPNTQKQTVLFMDFRAALIQILLDEAPDTLYGIYADIIGGVLANGKSTECPQGAGVPKRLKQCKSKTYPETAQEFAWIKAAFQVAQKNPNIQAVTATSTQPTVSSTTVTTNQVLPSSGFVQEHGDLRAKNSQLLDKNGQAVQLAGMSLFWSGFKEGEPFYNENVVKTLKSDWNVTLIRAAMQVDQDGVGYKINRGEKHKILRIVEECIKQGIYVIIDWHTYNLVTEEAIEFFSEMAQLYGQIPNVIFEIYNEPVGKGWGNEVKPYAEKVVAKIREKGAKNLIIVGTKDWSSNPQEAAADRLSDQNVAYVLHFYAASHRDDYRQKARDAMAQGATVFVSEFGTCEASGDGRFDPEESERWMQFLDEKKISWANWAISNKAETCAALRPGANPNGNWSDDQITESGLWIRGKLRKRR